MSEQKNKKPIIVESPTKPGPGYVQVTSEIIDEFQAIVKNLRKLSEQLKNSAPGMREYLEQKRKDRKKNENI